MIKVLFISSIFVQLTTLNTFANNTYIMDTLPPVAETQPKTFTLFGDTRTDNYFWMRLTDQQKEAKQPDEQTTKVVNYLKAENAYRQQQMKHTEALQATLFEEIKSRIKQDDKSVPYIYDGYYYISRFETGKEYPIHSRKKENLDAAEEIMLNLNDLAKGYSYYAIGGRNISTNNKILAYGVDTLSRRQYFITFKNLETGQQYNDIIPNTTGSVTWANDNKTVFYTRKDEALRSYKIYRHTLGTPTNTDVLIYHEKDEKFNVSVTKTKTKQFIIIASNATLSAEYSFLNANNPNGQFTLFEKRQDKLEYTIDQYENNWYILTNKDAAENFKIMTTPLNNTSLKNWVDLIPHNKNILITDFDLFKNHMVISERVGGITQLKIRPWTNGKPFYIKFNEPSYTVGANANLNFNTNVYRLSYTSLTTPPTVYDYNIPTKKLTLLKQTEVLGNFNPNNYTSERVMVKANDGTMIPMSIVYKKGFPKNGTSPVLLYGYGSYGISTDPYFSADRLSMLNRGFAFAIAHIRGGQEMGRSWYENGKFLKKKNTFTDFIACGQYLVNNKYAAKNKLFANGGSAGGLLMGAVLNMAPNLWRGVIADVPFVDVINTMIDETIPLTTGEFDEWGNPKQKEYYNYIKSYSPYDNVAAVNYPAILVTTGYWDSQVQYWEPAKWVAKLRQFKTDNNPLYLYCNMETGHGGASGRFKRIYDVARNYAFLFDLLGIKN